MALYAIPITIYNIDSLAPINNGVRPSDEYLESLHYFIRDTDPEGLNVIVNKAQLLRNYWYVSPDLIFDYEVVKKS